MKSVLIIGMGRFGVHVAKELNKTGAEIMAVDCNEDRINSILGIVTNAQIGDASNPDFLRSLGIKGFDVCIVTTAENFQVSLEVTSLLKEMGAKKVVSRASNETHRKFLLRNGADEVVYPEKQLAAWLAIRSSSDGIRDYINLPGEYAIYEIDVPERWAGHTVGYVNVRKKYGLNILGIKSNGVLNPEITTETKFLAGDTIMVLGTQKSISKCFHL